MKYRIIALLLLLAVLFVCFLLFGGNGNSTQPEQSAPQTAPADQGIRLR